MCSLVARLPERAACGSAIEAASPAYASVSMDTWMNPHWQVKSFASSHIEIPAVPGLYALGHIDELLGLPIAHAYVYVGKSDNLRRRIDEHHVFVETNPGLVEYLRKTKKRVCVWYTTQIPAQDLDRCERQLIRKLDPQYNRISYKTERGSD